MYMHACIRTYVRTYIHTYKYIYIYVPAHKASPNPTVLEGQHAASSASTSISKGIEGAKSAMQQGPGCVSIVKLFSREVKCMGL